MALEEFKARISLLLEEMVNQPEDQHEIQEQLREKLQEMRAELAPIGKTYEALAVELKKAQGRTTEKQAEAAIKKLRADLAAFANPAAVREGGPLELDVLRKVAKLFDDLQQVDAGPTPQQEIACGDLQREARAVVQRWPSILPEVTDLNQKLQAAGVEPIKLP